MSEQGVDACSQQFRLQYKKKILKTQSKDTESVSSLGTICVKLKQDSYLSFV